MPLLQVFVLRRTSLLKEERMSVSEAIGLMFAFGMLILALLTYIHLTQRK